MVSAISQHNLLKRLSELNSAEEDNLSPLATKSREGLRRRTEAKEGYRQQFALDADRILHSRAYTRYIDKTQVFCLVENDHITHRVLHVQLVSRIARTIGRYLHLNEDLIEAIALGHDIGHPPFGHDGETFLAEICTDYGLPPFQHNLQSVRFLDHIEKKGAGWNLTVQTLDGILCHDGEVHSRSLKPDKELSFDSFDEKFRMKEADPKQKVTPSTLEGCVVRLADTIAYIGRDIEDAIVLGLIKREDIPDSCRKQLGETNGTIVYNLVTDLTLNSYVPLGKTDPEENCSIGFSRQTSDVLKELKKFNYERIYFAPQTKKSYHLIRDCYRMLFDKYHSYLVDSSDQYTLEVDLMQDIYKAQDTPLSPALMVRDFIAGMTDDFFIKQAAQFGCKVPEKI